MSAVTKSEEEWNRLPYNRHHRDTLETLPNSWILRECHVYKDEYTRCSSFRGKLQMYYVNGKITSCEDWKKSYDDCKLWQNNADVDAATRVIQREENRIAERLKGHYENDVWELRNKEERPPPDWNKPLPEHLADAAEDSYLKAYKESKSHDCDHYDGTGLAARATRAKMVGILPQCNIL